MAAAGAVARRDPAFLQEGDLIGLFSPAGRAPAGQIADGAAGLLGLGLEHRPFAIRPKEGGYLAGPDDERVEELLYALRDHGHEALFAIRGGYGSMRLLPALKDLWKSLPPKPIVGFSDVTALHLSRLANSGVGGWHGPNLVSIPKLSGEAAGEAIGTILGRGPKGWGMPEGSALAFGRAEGPCLGGNLTILSHLYGTPHCPSARGAILLLEDTGERPYRLDRLLTGLSLRGAFRGVAGVLFGCLDGPKGEGSVPWVLEGFAASLRCPVAFGAPFGHGARNLPWFYGEPAVLEAGPGGSRIAFTGRGA
jgi:muramoyltetrapeptide carboxypeptidase